MKSVVSGRWSVVRPPTQDNPGNERAEGTPPLSFLEKAF
jgi:hypothetical protein